MWEALSRIMLLLLILAFLELIVFGAVIGKLLEIIW